MGWLGSLRGSAKAGTELLRVLIASQQALRVDGGFSTAAIMSGNRQCVAARLSDEHILRYSHDVLVRPVQLTRRSGCCCQSANVRGGRRATWNNKEGDVGCVFWPRESSFRRWHSLAARRIHEETLDLLSVCLSAYLGDLLSSCVQP